MWSLKRLREYTQVSNFPLWAALCVNQFMNDSLLFWVVSWSHSHDFSRWGSRGRDHYCTLKEISLNILISRFKLCVCDHHTHIVQVCVCLDTAYKLCAASYVYTLHFLLDWPAPEQQGSISQHDLNAMDTGCLLFTGLRYHCNLLLTSIFFSLEHFARISQVKVQTNKKWVEWICLYQVATVAP